MADSMGNRSGRAELMETNPPSMGKRMIWAAAFVIAVIVAVAGIVVAVIMSRDRASSPAAALEDNNLPPTPLVTIASTEATKEPSSSVTKLTTPAPADAPPTPKPVVPPTPKPVVPPTPKPVVPPTPKPVVPPTPKPMVLTPPPTCQYSSCGISGCIGVTDQCCDESTGEYCDDQKCWKDSPNGWVCIPWSSLICQAGQYCTESQVCCGSACCDGATQECCVGGCMPKGATCCPAGGYCAAGEECRGDHRCFPAGVSICGDLVTYCETGECCFEPPNYTCYRDGCPLPGNPVEIDLSGRKTVYSIDYTRIHTACCRRTYEVGHRVVWDLRFVENIDIESDLEGVIREAVQDTVEWCVTETLATSGLITAISCAATGGAGCVAIGAAFLAFLAKLGTCIVEKLPGELESELEDYAQRLADQLEDAIRLEWFDEYKFESCTFGWC